MHNPKQVFLSFSLICAGAALLLCSGCVTLSSDFYKTKLSSQPSRSPIQIDGSATVETVCTLTPDMEKLWTGAKETMANYLQAEKEILSEDITNSGLFARILPVGGSRPDYVIKIQSLESHPSDYRLQITIQALDPTTRQEISAHSREASVGTSMLNLTFDKTREALQQLMIDLKADLAADLQKNSLLKQQQKQQQATLAEIDTLQNASLADLLVSADKTESLARARNRAIVAAKNHQLPAILREKKTEELTELVVKIEQTILDLNHECEVAKDQAQQSVASGDAPAPSARGGRGSASPATTSLEEIRGLTICYRERIELLKPILGALKEEILNRSR